MIEARSCERFRLLSEGLEEENIRKFYHQFMVSEAGHYRLFIELAERYLEKEIVRTHWQYWLSEEAKLLQSAEIRGDRIH